MLTFVNMYKPCSKLNTVLIHGNWSITSALIDDIYIYIYILILRYTKRPINWDKESLEK